ncbi:MAG: Rieske (2Fe-2S) protein [Ignavibacteriales bacterium]|nr:Rieske (2Fe-2S) protein [Ignavibacteriales bacterium]MBI3787169.1 Rieske (2Fe-2S) protein [Ignavibacteriales bacterium]
MSENLSEQSEYTKRDFLKIVLSGGLIAWLASILYPVLAYMKPPKQAEVEVSSVKVGKLKDIEKEAGTIVRFGNKPVILIRTANDELHAFSATCTHLDCTVQFRKDMGLIWCACHNGKYDLNGRNVAGPPPRPLDDFRVVIQGEDVFISKKS